MIKICIVGTAQSGSTRVFNLIRMIYEKKGKIVYSGGGCSSWAELERKIISIDKSKNKPDIILSKVHDTSYTYLNNYDIKILPLRNIIDAAMSSGHRIQVDSTRHYIKHCIYNIDLFNKFKPYVDFVFRYENYSVNYIKKLCDILNVKLNNCEIIEIMKELESMLHNKNIVIKDDPSNIEYKKTLLSQNHNTSNGKINKFVNLSPKKLINILENDKILDFLNTHNYF